MNEHMDVLIIVQRKLYSLTGMGGQTFQFLKTLKTRIGAKIVFFKPNKGLETLVEVQVIEKGIASHQLLTVPINSSRSWYKGERH
jgi:hypothetical protein